MLRVSVCLFAVGAAVLMMGCDAKMDSSDSGHNEQSSAEDAAHTHAVEGPHGGHLIELGQAYDAELVADHDAHTVTVYVQECESQEPPKVDVTAMTLSIFKDGEFVDFALNAGSESGVFSLADEALCHLLDHSEDIKSRLKATIGGVELVAKYEHESHGAEDSHDQE